MDSIGKGVKALATEFVSDVFLLKLSLVCQCKPVRQVGPVGTGDREDDPRVPPGCGALFLSLKPAERWFACVAECDLKVGDRSLWSAGLDAKTVKIY